MFIKTCVLAAAVAAVIVSTTAKPEPESANAASAAQEYFGEFSDRARCFLSISSSSLPPIARPSHNLPKSHK